MYNSILSILFFFFIVACSNNSGENSTEQNNSQSTSQQEEDPEAAKGLELMANSDCLTCHRVSETLTGPSYEAIAAKYPLNQQTEDTLTQRIIKGSHGVWGDIPMTAHSDLSDQNARAMVKYILSLKK